MATLEEIVKESQQEMAERRKPIEWDSQEELCAVRKSKKIVTVAKRLTKDGEVYFDIRNFIILRGEVVPTQKGVLLNKEQMQEIFNALRPYFE